MNEASILKARIISVKDYQASDGPEDFYIGPDRTDLAIKAINCSNNYFLKVFLGTDEGQSFVMCSSGLILLGATRLDISLGAIITASFEEYYSNLIELMSAKASNEIRLLHCSAKERLGLL